MKPIDHIRKRLIALAEPRYQAFAASLIPGEQTLLGVRLPTLRKLAQEIARHQREEIVHETSPPQSMEECMLRGMLIGYAEGGISCEQRMAELTRFIPFITNWSICDSCCATYKFAREHQDKMWGFLQPYLQSHAEFEARFALVMLLQHFVVQKKWADHTATILPTLPCKGYYAEMAAAWLLCEIHFLHPIVADPLLGIESRLRESIRARALRKIRESRRITISGK